MSAKFMSDLDLIITHVHQQSARIAGPSGVFRHRPSAVSTGELTPTAAVAWLQKAEAEESNKSDATRNAQLQDLREQVSRSTHTANSWDLLASKTIKKLDYERADCVSLTRASGKPQPVTAGADTAAADSMQLRVLYKAHMERMNFLVQEAQALQGQIEETSSVWKQAHAGRVAVQDMHGRVRGVSRPWSGAARRKTASFSSSLRRLLGAQSPPPTRPRWKIATS